MGTGDIGTPLGKLAAESGNEVVVTERDPERAERASKQNDCPVINDGATSKAPLSDAGADRTDALIPTTDQDATTIVVLGAVAFPIHYVVLADREWAELYGDLQTRWLFVLFALGIIVLSLQNALSVSATTDAPRPVVPAVRGPGRTRRPARCRQGLDVPVVSALSCTGFQSAPIGRWVAGGKLMFVGAMTLRGAAGSAVGLCSGITGPSMHPLAEGMFLLIM